LGLLLVITGHIVLTLALNLYLITRLTSHCFWFRHALPLFTSLLNTVCGYDPAGILPYNHLLFSDTREELVETAIQVLIITLDHDSSSNPAAAAAEALLLADASDDRHSVSSLGQGKLSKNMILKTTSKSQVQ